MALTQKSFNIRCIMKHILNIVMLRLINKSVQEVYTPSSRDLTTLQSYHKNTTVPEFDFNKLFLFVAPQ